MAANTDGLLKGRPVGSKNRRKVEGEDYARDILMQDDDDILVTTVTDEVPGKDGETKVVSREVEMDRHERAVSDPVFRALRRQARLGVGGLPGQLPPAVFTALSDRAFGKVVDKREILGGRPLANVSDEELRARMSELASSLTPAKPAREEAA